jgi:hypothetical protein
MGPERNVVISREWEASSTVIPTLRGTSFRGLSIRSDKKVQEVLADYMRAGSELYELALRVF